MGFTTGFLGGVTLTYSILYLSLYIHRANRNVQRTLLSQQAHLLNSVIDPPVPLPDPPAYEVRKAGLTEVLKDRWNREVEKLVHNVQETDWAQKRELYEERVATVWRKVRASEQGQEIEAKARELEQRLEKEAKVLGQTAEDKAKELGQTVPERARELGHSVEEKAKELGKTVGEKARELKQTVQEKVTGTEVALATAANEAKDTGKATTGREPRLLELK